MALCAGQAHRGAVPAGSRHTRWARSRHVHSLAECGLNRPVKRAGQAPRNRGGAAVQAPRAAGGAGADQGLTLVSFCICASCGAGHGLRLLPVCELWSPAAAVVAWLLLGAAIGEERPHEASARAAEQGGCVFVCVARTVGRQRSCDAAMAVHSLCAQVWAQRDGIQGSCGSTCSRRRAGSAIAPPDCGAWCHWCRTMGWPV